MILDECCLHHIPYEILDKIPTENDWDYPIPFVRIDKKDKKAWILVDNKDAKGTWIPFGGAQDAIEKIIISCGEIIPKAGVIEFIKGYGITFECDGNKLKFGLQIPILAKYGGTGYTEYNLGDLLVGNIDGTLSKIPKGENGQVLAVKEDGNLGYIDVVKKLTCDGSESVTENALTRWNADGSCLKDSKTIQDDQGNTTTTCTIDGELKVLLENLSSNDTAIVVYHLRSLVKTMIRQEIKEKQIWDAYIDPKDKSFKIDGNNLEDPTQTGNFFRINRKGNVSHPFQFRALALLSTNTTRVTGNGTLYKHGSANKLTILKDVGSQFYSGDGQGKGATFSVYEDNTYLIYMHITFNSFEDSPGEMINRVLSQSGRVYNGRGILAGGIGNNSVGLLIGIDAVMGDIFEFGTIGVMNPYELRVSFSGTEFPNLTTYIGVYCLG